MQELPNSTAEKLAESTGVSERTIRNDGKFAEATEKLGIGKEVMSGKEKRSRKQIIKEAFPKEETEPTPDDPPPAEKPKAPKSQPTFQDTVCTKFNCFLNKFPASERQQVIDIIRNQIA